MTVAVAAAFGYALVLVRAHFSKYDDEGVMLMALRQYVDGVPLYERYTGYGPFYYVLLSHLFAFVGVTHDAIRFTTILLWLLVAAGWATCIWLWRRSLGWTLVAFLTTVTVLGPLKLEPGHPQGLILLLYASAFVAASFCTTSHALAFGAIGAASAAMLLTKINVGGLMIASLAVVFVGCLNSRRRPRGLDVGVRTLCTLIPAVLMHAQFTNPVVVTQCAIYTFGIWAALDVLRRNTTPDLDWPALGWAAVGFLSTVLFIVGSVRSHGTPLGALFEGVILQPLTFAGAIPFQTHPLELFAGVLCCASGALLWVHERFRTGVPPYLRAAVALVVIIAAVALPRLATVIAPGVMWMFVLEPGGRLWQSTSRVPAFLVNVAATLGILMVYPVAGTQSSVAASLIVLAAFAALLHWSGELLQAIRNWRMVAASEWVLGGFILYATVGASAWQVTQALDRPALASEYLPQSRMIQLSTADYETYSEIISRVATRCDALVTVPGMNSFNIWSNLPHANGFIISSAMALFDEPVQRQLVKDFVTVSRPCVIWNPELEQWSTRYRAKVARQPFLDLVHHQLVRVYERNGYEIRVPPSQASGWR